MNKIVKILLIEQYFIRIQLKFNAHWPTTIERILDPSSNIKVLKLIDNDLVQNEVQNRVNIWFLPKLQIWMIHHADHLDEFYFSI